MKIAQKLWTEENNWESLDNSNNLSEANLVFIFGNRELLAKTDILKPLQEEYSEAYFLISSTAGEILDESVYDKSIVSTAILFEKTDIKVNSVNYQNYTDSFEIGKALVEGLPQENLKHLFIISDGLNVNGTALVEGAESLLGSDTSITGGLAGDEDKFEQTKVNLYKGLEEVEGNIIALGLYGESLKVGFGSFGGWEAFGTERTVTKSEGNVLFELDDSPALNLYKDYLGEKSKELPASALLFPLSLTSDKPETQGLVRTVLSIDEEAKTMTFAGDVPQGAKVRLMKTNVNNLTEGAETAAKYSKNFEPQLAILVSCVGRKLVMGQYVDDEIEAVKEIMGDNCAITGFYSYGELAPNPNEKKCYLHNQTMTITTFAEL